MCNCQPNNCGCSETITSYHVCNPCPPDPCACPVKLSSDCVTLDIPEPLSCSGIESGTILTDAIQQLDEYICATIDQINASINIVNIGDGAEIYKGIDGIGRRELKTITSTDDSVVITELTDTINLAVIPPDGSETKITAGTNITVTGTGTTTTPFIISASGGGVNDATTTVKGILKLAGDLGGTADLPTTPTAIHKTTNESFTGIKSATNAVGSASGLDLTNNTTGSSLSVSNTSGGIGVSISNSSTTGVGISLENTSTSIGIDLTNTSSGIGLRLPNNGAGTGLYVINSSTGKSIVSQVESTGSGIVSESTTSGTGFLFEGLNNGATTFSVDKFGNTTANTFVKAGGLATQFLKADGSVSLIDGSDTKINSGITTAVTGNGTIATPYSVETINLQKPITADYLLTSADNNYSIKINNGATPITITVPLGLPENFFVGFTQKGSGDVTFLGSVATISNPVGLKIKGQGYHVGLEQIGTSNSFDLLGFTKA